MSVVVHPSQTRQDILRSALRHFANSGYAAASVQRIVGDARVSKPSLYYYFPDKAGLFQALVDEAHDDRYRLIQAAAARGRTLKQKLVEILTALFDHMQRNRELTRISFATAFAAPGEVPEGLRCSDKCERNFELIHAIFQNARSEGEVDRRFGSRELAEGFYGQLNACLAAQLLTPASSSPRRTARRLVELFLAGAGARRRRSRA
jgi:AcrR family transcriptional regulator